MPCFFLVMASHGTLRDRHMGIRDAADARNALLAIFTDAPQDARIEVERHVSCEEMQARPDSVICWQKGSRNRKTGNAHCKCKTVERASAGINRHEAENESVLQERSSEPS